MDHHTLIRLERTIPYSIRGWTCLSIGRCDQYLNAGRGPLLRFATIVHTAPFQLVPESTPVRTILPASRVQYQVYKLPLDARHWGGFWDRIHDFRPEWTKFMLAIDLCDELLCARKTLTRAETRCLTYAPDWVQDVVLVRVDGVGSTPVFGSTLIFLTEVPVDLLKADVDEMDAAFKRL